MKPAKQPAKKRGWAREQVRLARKALRQWPSWLKPGKYLATCALLATFLGCASTKVPSECTASVNARLPAKVQVIYRENGEVFVSEVYRIEDQKVFRLLAEQDLLLLAVDDGRPPLKTILPGAFGVHSGTPARLCVLKR